MLGNLPNGIVTTLASHYVTNVMNADPETKLGYGQNAPLGSRPSRLVTCFVYLTLAMDHSRVSFLYAPVDDKPKNSVETVFTFTRLTKLKEPRVFPGQSELIPLSKSERPAAAKNSPLGD